MTTYNKIVNRPPQHILDEFSINENDWTAPQVGSIAKTFLGTDWVVQRRSEDDYLRYSTIIKYLEFWTKDPLFEGAQAEIIKDSKEGFWVKTKRLDTDETVYPWHPYGDSQAWWDYFVDVLPVVQETLLKLRSGPELPEELKHLDTRNGKNLQTVSSESILDIIRASAKKHNVLVDWLEDLGEEPVFPMYISHGDVLVKNIVHTSNGYRLIDWEFLSELPSDRDITRIVWHVLNRIPVSEWEKKMPVVQSLYKDFIRFGSDKEFQQAIVWGGLRILATWPRQGRMTIENKQTFEEILQGIRNLI